MNADEFTQSRQADWKSLSTLLDRTTNGAARLSPDEVNTLGRLYRATTSDLALAQRDFPNQRVTAYLNQLVARAHAALYQGEPLALRRLKRFITHGFPQTFRALWPFTLTAALLCIIPALVVGVVTYVNPEAARWMLPAQAQTMIPLIENKELWTDIPANERPYASAFIMQNNIQVAFLAFGGGMLAGVYTVWVMVFNGLLLGGITGLTAHYGIGWDLWEFVIGHGVVELTVIFMAGGAGLRLGWAILRPGLLRRRDALAEAGRLAVKVVVGCVPLLVLAGTIEGFISPNENIPVLAKWAVGLGTGAALYAYVGLAGRGGEDRHARPYRNAIVSMT
jgi:uncharacterized membrane protein SpoIIM required for sporulation